MSRNSLPISKKQAYADVAGHTFITERKGKRNNSILIGEESVLEEGLLVGTLSVGTIPELGKTFAFCV